MTTSRSQPNRPGPQLIPRRVLRSTQIHHPAVLDEARRRSGDFELRLADRITTFAGSMNFVYLHALLFAVWMLVLEKSPWPTLTPRRLAGGDFPVHLRDDRPEPTGIIPAGQGRPRLRRAGTRAEDQHRPHPADPHPGGRARQQVRPPTELRSRSSSQHLSRDSAPGG